MRAHNLVLRTEFWRGALGKSKQGGQFTALGNSRFACETGQVDAL